MSDFVEGGTQAIKHTFLQRLADSHEEQMMPKTQPLCADVELNLEDRILDEIEKNSFIVLPGKGGHLAHAPKTKI